MGAPHSIHSGRNLVEGEDPGFTGVATAPQRDDGVRAEKGLTAVVRTIAAFRRDAHLGDVERDRLFEPVEEGGVPSP